MELIIDLDHIEKGIKDIDRYAHLLDKAIDTGLYELAERMYDMIDVEAGKYGLEESDLMATKDVDYGTDTITLKFTAPYADFVEYGTGVVGEANAKNPAMPSYWQFNVGVTIKPDGRWFYYDKDLGKVMATRGQPAKPIMYNVRQWAINSGRATRILRKHIRRIKV